jgi:hypothetical protein
MSQSEVINAVGASARVIPMSNRATEPVQFARRHSTDSFFDPPNNGIQIRRHVETIRLNTDAEERDVKSANMNMIV